MIRGLLFDLNGTVVDIWTDESSGEIYRMLANLLDYQGVRIEPEELRRQFYDINKRQRRESFEEHPEFNVAAIFQEIVDRYGSAYTRTLPPERLAQLPGFLAETFRAASRSKLQLYPGVREVLDYLKARYMLAAVSDGQSLWAHPELQSVGLADYFDPVLVSSDFGFRKPDARMFEFALAEMELKPEEAVFIGNDMYRDVWGAHQAGMKTVFFQSNQGDWKSRGVEADYIIYNFRELPEAIRFLSK